MNKLAVITGGTKGIGKAIIEQFAAQGFDIATCARNESDLAELVKTIKQDHGCNVHTKVVDVSKKQDVTAFAQMVAGLKQPVDVLVNNAGVFIPGQVHSEEEGNLEMMIETNLYSAYQLTRMLIPDMMQQKRGHVFNICSTASIMPYVNGGSYCISKYAMLGMTKVLREEMKEHQVKVTAIMPGATFTASWEGTELPEDRFMPAADVARSVYNAFTMSPSTVIEEIVMRPQLGDL